MSAVIEAKNNQVATQAPTPATLLQMAVEQGADLDRLERLMGLQERWEDNEAKKAFTIAMTSFRSQCPQIDKDKKGHNSKYATLAHTLDLVREPMSSNGLSHRWETEQQENGIVSVTCFVTHSLGFKESTKLVACGDTSGSKNAIQAIGSTISYLQRYTLFSILGLASADQDDDGKSSGDSSQSAAAVEEKWIKKIIALRELIPSIQAIKTGIATQNLEGAIEAWRELSRDEQNELWFPAPTQGGILTTEERTVIKSDEWASVGRGLS
jgi:hypothetical protein